MTYVSPKLRQAMIDILIEERDALRAALRHEADCVEAAKAEIAALRAAQQLALEVLENVRGNINPERGYADELEADVERAITAIEAGEAMGAQVAEAAKAEIERLRNVESAARNLVAQRGRHNTEIAYGRLVDALKP